ncbi:hypothetical protein K1719_015546 [Acacia pycnantha]|nr:hypothetical protein K1719_015546 [Acacia pycnantha]
MFISCWNLIVVSTSKLEAFSDKDSTSKKRLLAPNSFSRIYQELEQTKIGQSDERTIYEVQQGREPLVGKLNSTTVPSATSKLSPLPPEPYDRGATIDIPLDSSKDVKGREKEL